MRDRLNLFSLSPRNYYTLHETCEILEVTRRTVDRYVSQKKLTRRKQGNLTYFLKIEVQQLKTRRDQIVEENNEHEQTLPDSRIAGSLSPTQYKQHRKWQKETAKQQQKKQAGTRYQPTNTQRWTNEKGILRPRDND